MEGEVTGVTLKARGDVKGEVFARCVGGRAEEMNGDEVGVTVVGDEEDEDEEEAEVEMAEGSEEGGGRTAEAAEEEESGSVGALMKATPGVKGVG